MAREINRKRLTRLFQLPDGAEDAEVIEKIRLYTERLNTSVRPFVLPVGLDLRGCLYALWDCMQQDREFGEEAYGRLCDEIDKLRAENAQCLRPVDARFTMLEIVIDRARDQTEWEDPAVLTARRKEQALAKKEAERERRRQKKAAKDADAAGRT